MRVAVIFDNINRPETTGVYCQRALGQLVDAGVLVEVQHFLPSQLHQIPHGSFDLFIVVDDGLNTGIPEATHPAAWWAIDTHLEFERCLTVARQADWTFCAQRDGTRRMQEAGVKHATWLPLACDPKFHGSVPTSKQWDVAFVGHVFPGERQRLLDLVLSRFPNSFVGHRYFKEMAEAYSAARCVFNRSIANDVNMRVFEALCSGSLLITNALDENGLGELFRDGVHLATYVDDDELLQKIRYYLEHADERERIAAAGRAEVLAQHTYLQRMETILAHVRTSALHTNSPTAHGRNTAQSLCPITPAKEPGYFECDRPDVLELIPTAARRILDIGCGAGRLGAALKSRQSCEVVGVEMNARAAAHARDCLDDVAVGNIESSAIDFPAGRFDCIICADVLEHLREPVMVLRRIHRWLSPNGCLVSSIPNVRNVTVVQSLLAGNWTYESAGLLDADHVRFFTRREIEKLLFRCGFEIDALQMVPGEGFQTWLDLGRPLELSVGGLQIRTCTERDALEFFAYQWLTCARRVQAPDYGLTSIIVVTHNQLPYTRACLDSVRLRTDEPYELIVIDNGSTDGTVEYLRSLPDVHLIANDSNDGFPAAANQGLAVATGAQLLLLNNDTIVTTGWLRRLLKALHSDPAIGLVGPVSNNVSGEQQIVTGYSHLADLDGWAWDRQLENAGIQDTDRLVGFCLLVRRPVVDRIGVLDERFGIGCFEDDDFCRRALAAGYRAVIAHASFVHHFGSTTFQASGIALGELLTRNRRLFELKWRDDAREFRTDRESGLTQCAPAGSIDAHSRPAFIIANQLNGGLLLRPNTIRLSVCLIVRDNEDTIRPCLMSIRPWVDEIVVVDTGSTDQTPAICEELGARVFHWHWQDSFAAARNISLSHARGEWLFWMDSDDTIPPECGQKLRALADGPHPDDVFGYVMQVHCPGRDPADVTVVDHVKLVRNRPDVRFEFRIHEQVLPAIRRAGGNVVFTDIHVEHSGSDHSPEGRQRKLERDFKLLDLELQERPDHPFVLFNLGMTHADAGQHVEAIEFLERCISVSPPDESHVRKAFALLVSALSQIGETAAAVNHCDEGLRRFPADKELLFRRAMLHHAAGELQAAAAIYHQILEEQTERHFTSVDHGVSGFKARYNLAAVLSDQGKTDGAIAEWKRLIALHPEYQLGWRRLGEALLNAGQPGAARCLVARLASQSAHPIERLLLLSRIARHEGDLDQALTYSEAVLAESPADPELLNDHCRLLFEQGRPAAALPSLSRLADLTPNDPSVYHNLGIAQMQLGRFEPAIESFNRSLSLRPDYALTLKELAHALERCGRDHEASRVRQYLSSHSSSP